MGLVVADKAQRVFQFHAKTVHSVVEMCGAAGVRDPAQLRPHHIFRRMSATQVQHLGEIMVPLEPRQLIDGDLPMRWRQFWLEASPDHFVT